MKGLVILRRNKMILLRLQLNQNLCSARVLDVEYYELLGNESVLPRILGLLRLVLPQALD